MQSSLPAKPAEVFDREHEWEDLLRFLTGPVMTQLGIVFGRRRQGKSFLLDAALSATKGVAVEAVEGSAQANLDRLAAEIGSAYLGAPLRFGSWEEAFTWMLSRDDDVVFVLDEAERLLAADSALESVLQAALDKQVSSPLRRSRIVLCGSASSIMSQLLIGSASLRGRSGLMLRVNPLDFRDAAAFWGYDSGSFDAAVLVHSVLGGTAGYRALAETLAPAPRSPDELGEWLVATVLNPASALFTEATMYLAEDPTIRNRSVYHDVLAAIANGDVTVRGVATTVQRSSATVSQQLNTLVGLDLLGHLDDPLRKNRGIYEISEPIVAFHHAIMYPGRNRRRLERRQGAEVWAETEAAYRTHILGPHIEHLARHWTDRYASAETVGAEAPLVGRTYISDPVIRSQREIDVLVIDDRKRITAIGEVKAGRLDGRALAATEHRRQLLIDSGKIRDGTCKLLLFSIGGFTADVIEVGAHPDIELIDLNRLYDGD